MERKSAMSRDPQFSEWLTESVDRNPNLRPLASDIEGFSEEDFGAWIERALIRIVIEGREEAEAFSPGESIIGTSQRGWRDDLFAVIALLEDSVKATAIRGIVRCFKGIAPRPSDNDIFENGGKNWEQYVVELMRLVRDLRSPLCDIEATPLRELDQLLRVKFPNSQAVLDEGLLLWRAFAHQIEADEEWDVTFGRHPRFRDEYIPLVAFAHVVRFPAKVFFYLSEWGPYRHYRRRLLADSGVDQSAKRVMKQLYRATENVVRFAANRGVPIGISELEADPTYKFLSLESAPPRFQQRDANSIIIADAEAKCRKPRSLLDMKAMCWRPSRDDVDGVFSKNERI